MGRGKFDVVGMSDKVEADADDEPVDPVSHNGGFDQEPADLTALGQNIVGPFAADVGVGCECRTGIGGGKCRNECDLAGTVRR